MFVLEAETKESAAGEKEFWFVAMDSTKDKERGAHPEKRFERVHGEARSIAEDYGSEQDGEASEKDGEALAAEFAGDEASDENLCALGESGKRADSVKGIAEEESANAEKQRCERGEINVAPGKMVAAGEEIEFVAKVAVAAVGSHLEQDCGSCEEPGDRHFSREEGAGWHGANRPGRSG